MSPLTQLILGSGAILVGLLVSKLYFDQYLEIKRLEGKLEAERHRQRHYQETLDSLDREIALFRTEKGIEIMAREKLKFVRPDEMIVVPVE